MKEIRRSKRLSSKLYTKYVGYLDNIFFRIRKYQLSFNNERNIKNIIKNYFNMYKTINLNIGLIRMYRSINDFEKFIKALYNNTFIINNRYEKYKCYVNIFSKFSNEIKIARENYQYYCNKKYYFLKNILNSDLINLIDNFL